MKYVLIILTVIFIGNMLNDESWKDIIKRMEEERDE